MMKYVWIVIWYEDSNIVAVFTTLIAAQEYIKHETETPIKLIHKHPTREIWGTSDARDGWDWILEKWPVHLGA